ncbi:MAG: CheY-like chemotaxis protein [Flavobacterium sp.]|jgi:CheY-like chemotaxis protein
MIPVHILLVEDNEGDILLTTEALEEFKICNKLSVVRNGKLAIDFIQKKGEFKDVERPDIIILDINLPLKNGVEVLEVIKSDSETKSIPVIMLTTSSSETDIVKSYANNANAFITKPMDVVDFLKAIMGIEDFWLNIVQLPKTN